MEWPRIPLPGWPDGTQDRAAEELAESAARGCQLAALLDSDTPVPGVTEPIPGAPSSNALRPEIAAIAVPTTTEGGNMTADDFALTAGWGHFGSGQAVMPGQGRASRARIHDRRTRRPRRRRPDPRRHHLRHLPKRPSLLAQHPLRRLDLQARRLPGPKKVALLPRPK